MLLETLDLRTKDVLIYSQNLFNFNDNFKIILKNERIKRPRRISYFDVCTYVKDPSPKNLIVYRLLTNVNSLDAYSTKYGYFIKINGKVELVYFDPIFAIKDLRHLRFDLNPSRFRFRIQQLGLTSLTKKESEANFAEVYSFDLKAVEAQSQNDKIFADAIFAFDDTFVEDEDEEKYVVESGKRNQVTSIISADSRSKLIDTAKQISEDKSTQTPAFQSPTPPDLNRIQDLREEIIVLLKQALGIPEGSQFSDRSASAKKIEDLIQQQKYDEAKNSETSGQSVFDLFKTTNKSVELSERERKSIVLKFD
jgi:hypothetical protein